MSGTLATIAGIGTEASSLIFGAGGEVVLGDIAFASFEVPEKIALGGSQHVAKHTMPGGKRVIDALGRDDRDLQWSGIFLSADAAERAAAVDAMRVAGKPVALMFGDYTYTVVLTEFSAELRRPGHMPYQITCMVLRDESQGPQTGFLSAALQVLSDLNTALQPLDILFAAPPSGDPTPMVVVALDAANAAALDGLRLGSATYVDTVAALAAAEAEVLAGIASSGQVIDAGATQDGSLVGSMADFQTIVGQSGASAQLTAAGAYVGRASRNAVLGSV